MKIKPYLHIHGIASTKTSNNVPWSNGLKTNQINWVTRLQKKEVIKLHLVEMLSLSKRTVAYITNYGNIFLQRSVVEFKPYAWVWEVKSGNANRQRINLQKRSTDELHLYGNFQMKETKYNTRSRKWSSCITSTIRSWWKISTPEIRKKKGTSRILALEENLDSSDKHGGLRKPTP